MWEETKTTVISRPLTALPVELPSRVVVESVSPEIDCGRFPIKRTVGEEVIVSADIHADGHDSLAALLRYRHAGDASWQEVPMTELGNDRWQGKFAVNELGRHEYTVEAWIDGFASWRKGFTKKVNAGQDVASELLEGAALIREAGDRADHDDGEWLHHQADLLTDSSQVSERAEKALSASLAALVSKYPDRSHASVYDHVLQVVVDRERARFGAWYELFPRSCASGPGTHGTLNDCACRLEYVASMGFDVVYLPPIHPIGRSFRKGPNNSLQAGPHDPGSPWAIGSSEGGHTAVHPDLGTLDDFDNLVAAAHDLGLEIALDIAFQCSPDHPWVREHPEWFRHRPDGSIKYAENPPKKYQDIYPLDFECDDWRELWNELRDVVSFWIEHGVRIFRVDNPHTKPFRFWEWLIRDIQDEYPDTIFLAEAFTRPKIMRYLAKCGFTQSYTYFTWRNTKAELTEYFTELTQTAMREYFRPNLFANTPDILTEYLQFGGGPAFQTRLVLAATLGATYGIYGPGFEFHDNRAVPGSEEYHDSEKYQIRHWDWDKPDSLREFITRINEIRRQNAALQFNGRLEFYPTDNDQLICYGKSSPDLGNVIIVVVNVDPHHKQTGWVRLPVAEFGLPADGAYQVHDLLSEARYLWHGERNYVELDPSVCPASIFRLRRRIKSERDFDYYL